MLYGFTERPVGPSGLATPNMSPYKPESNNPPTIDDNDERKKSRFQRRVSLTHRKSTLFDPNVSSGTSSSSSASMSSLSARMSPPPNMYITPLETTPINSSSAMGSMSQNSEEGSSPVRIPNSESVTDLQNQFNAQLAEKDGFTRGSHREGTCYYLSRFPILFGIGFILFFEFLAYVTVRMIVIIQESLSFNIRKYLFRRNYRYLYDEMNKAKTYFEYRRIVGELDFCEGKPQGDFEGFANVIGLIIKRVTKHLRTLESRLLSTDDEMTDIIDPPINYEIFHQLGTFFRVPFLLQSGGNNHDQRERMKDGHDVTTKKSIEKEKQKVESDIEIPDKNLANNGMARTVDTTNDTIESNKGKERSSNLMEDSDNQTAKVHLELINALKTLCVPKLGGEDTEDHYVHNNSGRNRAIEESVKQTCHALLKVHSYFGPGTNIHKLRRARSESKPQYPYPTKMKTRREEEEDIRAFQKDLKLKNAFFDDLAVKYGRSALFLSGGAANGYYHLGVVKALLTAKMLPRVITGSSAGSLIGALTCCKTDTELQEILGAFSNPEDLETWENGPRVKGKRGKATNHSSGISNLCARFQPCEGTILEKVMRFYNTGAAFDPIEWKAKMQQHITGGDLTFREAYMRTGRALNISVFNGSTASILLNYKTAPNVVIWSAVLASSSLPLLLPAQPLFMKVYPTTNSKKKYKLKEWAMGILWRDGSFEADLPFAQLQRSFGCSFSIVSQVEPHLNPFFFHSKGAAGIPTYHNDGKGWRGGFVLSTLEHALKLEMKKWLTLVSTFGLLPPILGTQFGHLWTQQTWGDVTILPQLCLEDFMFLMADPCPRKMKRYLYEGQKATWRKLGMIGNKVRIESTIRGIRWSLARAQKYLDNTLQTFYERNVPSLVHGEAMRNEERSDDEANRSSVGSMASDKIENREDFDKTSLLKSHNNAPVGLLEYTTSSHELDNRKTKRDGRKKQNQNKRVMYPKKKMLMKSDAAVGLTPDSLGGEAVQAKRKTIPNGLSPQDDRKNTMRLEKRLPGHSWFSFRVFMACLVTFLVVMSFGAVQWKGLSEVVFVKILYDEKALHDWKAFIIDMFNKLFMNFPLQYFYNSNGNWTSHF
eukprot:g3238.t1